MYTNKIKQVYIISIVPIHKYYFEAWKIYKLAWKIVTFENNA